MRKWLNYYTTWQFLLLVFVGHTFCRTRNWTGRPWGLSCPTPLFTWICQEHRDNGEPCTCVIFISALARERSELTAKTETSNFESAHPKLTKDQLTPYLRNTGLLLPKDAKEKITFENVLQSNEAPFYPEKSLSPGARTTCWVNRHWVWKKGLSLWLRREHPFPRP